MARLVLKTALIVALLTSAPEATADQPAAPPQQDAPNYRYVPVRTVEPGSTLYAYWENGPNVPIATDLFAHLDLQKSILATDQKGIDELKAAGRLANVPVGTAVKVLRYDKGLVAGVPSYEVRILEGRHADRKGWVVSTWARARVAAPETPKEKARAARKARR